MCCVRVCMCVCPRPYCIVFVHSVEPLDDLQRVQQSIKEYLVAGMPKTSPKWTKKVGASIDPELCVSSV